MIQELIFIIWRIMDLDKFINFFFQKLGIVNVKKKKELRGKGHIGKIAFFCSIIEEYI